jgi:hypothetical protein
VVEDREQRLGERARGRQHATIRAAVRSCRAIRTQGP